MATWIKITNGSITMEIPKGELDLYKHAGYSVVVEEPIPAEQPALPIETKAEEIKSPIPAEQNAAAVADVNQKSAKKK